MPKLFARTFPKARFALGLAFTIAAGGVARPAAADDKAACLAAASKGQRFRDTHKLVEAREQLRICAAAVCPGVVQGDCATWLADVERAIPTVVVTAKSGAGAALVDVKVTSDGQLLSNKLDGQAIVIDPGAHTLHFETSDGKSLDQQIVVSEGERNQRVAVVIGPVSESLRTEAADKPASSSAGGPWRTLGWILGGAGIVGLGVGTAFGIVAINDNSSAHCNASHQCEPGPLSDARSAAVGSDVGLIAGGVLLVAGGALVLFGPKDDGKDHARPVARITPLIDRTGGGVAIGGAW